MSDTPKPATVRLSPPQLAALCLIEQSIFGLANTAQMARALKADPLALACAEAGEALKKAHEEFFKATQTRVSIAAPSEMAEAVKALVQP